MSISSDEIRATLARYLDRHPDEAGHLRPLSEALSADADLTSREWFDGGHVTCGAVVIDRERRLLLVRHRALRRWLLPGGHLEPGDATLPGAALRELAEEAGISWNGVLAPPGHDVTPVDIDLHMIPANPVRSEPEHWHADFRWTFRVESPEVVLQAEEVAGYAWRPRTDAPTPRLVAKLAAL